MSTRRYYLAPKIEDEDSGLYPGRSDLEWDRYVDLLIDRGAELCRADEDYQEALKDKDTPANKLFRWFKLEQALTGVLTAELRDCWRERDRAIVGWSKALQLCEKYEGELGKCLEKLNKIESLNNSTARGIQAVLALNESFKASEAGAL